MTDGYQYVFGLDRHIECRDGKVCDFPNAQISLNLPAGVTYTSDSGLFLLASSSNVMSVLPSTVENFYNSVLDAYNSTSSGPVTWLLKQQTPPVSLDIAKAIDVTLKGGYDGTFYTNSGTYSTLQGIIVGTGSLTVENILII